jgi:hypothetical protein
MNPAFVGTNRVSRVTAPAQHRLARDGKRKDEDDDE